MDALSPASWSKSGKLSWVHFGDLPPAIAAGGALVVYLLTLAPDLTWAHFGSDGGELIAAAVTLGVPHPPGYPTYVLLGRLASELPMGTVAFRFHLFSAISTAVATGFVAAAGRALLPATMNRARIANGALAGGLTFALLPLVWSQALIAEVYALNLALLAAFLWALLSDRPAWLVGLLLGLATTAHLTSLAMLPLAVTVTNRRQWLPLLATFALGLAPFLALPLLAAGDSPIVWGEPTTLAGWWWLVSGRLYHPNLFALPPIEWARRLFTWESPWALSLAPLIVALVSVRLSSGAARRRQLLLFGTAVFFILYSLSYDAPDAALFALPALLLLSVGAMGGLAHLGPSAFLLPVALLVLNFNSLNLKGRQELRPLAENVWQAAPPGALLLTTGDKSTFTLWHYHYAERRRPDVLLVDTNLFAFDWYRRHLGELHPGLRHLATDDLEGFHRLNGRLRPVCEVRLSLQEEPASVPIIQCLEE